VSALKAKPDAAHEAAPNPGVVFVQRGTAPEVVTLMSPLPASAPGLWTRFFPQHEQAADGEAVLPVKRANAARTPVPTAVSAERRERWVAVLTIMASPPIVASYRT
jgi:hypothetical protein